MSNNSVIEHRANYYYIMVQEDYLAICSNGKCSPHCKAMILAILEHWTNTKRDKGEGEYVYLTMPQWIKYTYMLYERNIITDCIKELLTEGLIERRPIIMFYQKTFDYKLCTENIQNLIRSLPTKRKEDVFPNLDAYLMFKERGKTERAEKREKEGVSEKSRTSKKGKTEGKEVRELSPTVREKSQGVGDNSPMVGDFSQEVREKSTQLILTKILLTSTNIQEDNNFVVADANNTTISPSQENEIGYPQPPSESVDNSIQTDIETSVLETPTSKEPDAPEEASKHPIAAKTTKKRSRKPAAPKPEKPLVVLTVEEQAFYNLYCELPWIKIKPILSEKVKEQCGQLAPHLQTKEQLRDMRKWMDKSSFYKGKGFRLGMLVTALNDWSDAQEGHPAKTDRVNVKNTNRATQSYTPEDYAEIGEVEQRQMDEFYAAHPELRVGA